jgi:hypothetical protein
MQATMKDNTFITGSPVDLSIFQEQSMTQVNKDTTEEHGLLDKGIDEYNLTQEDFENTEEENEKSYKSDDKDPSTKKNYNQKFY